MPPALSVTWITPVTGAVVTKFVSLTVQTTGKVKTVTFTANGFPAGAVWTPIVSAYQPVTYTTRGPARDQAQTTKTRRQAPAGQPVASVWDSRLVADGPYTLRATVRTASHQEKHADITISVVNGQSVVAPTVAITAPAPSATVAQLVPITATASSPSGIASVRFLVNGLTIGTVLQVPYTAIWTTGADGVASLTAVATDTTGLSTTSAPVSVTVHQTVIDPTPPTVTLIAPADGATLNSPVVIIAEAADNVAVASVQLLVNNVPVGTVLAPPYQITWRPIADPVTTTSAILTALATDTAGNQTWSAARTVFIRFLDAIPPVVTITSPINGASFPPGPVPIVAVATDNLQVASVQMTVDGAPVGTPVLTPPYTTVWTATTGLHVLRAMALDTAGNVGVTAQSVTVNVTAVDTVPPVVAVTAPVAGAVLAPGALLLQATATDNIAVASVQFLVDGSPVGSPIGTAPYQVMWTASLGAHTLAARATDRAGNVTTATSPVTIQSPITSGLLQPANFVYAGAFRLPLGPDTPNSFDYGGTALAFYPAHGSLLAVGNSQFQRTAEISIPTPVVSIHLADLPRATIMQTWTDVLAGRLNTVDLGFGRSIIGGFAPLDADLVVTAWVYYDAGGDQVLSHFKTRTNFAAITPSDVVGPYQVVVPVPGYETGGAGFVAGWMVPVPAEWQADLGGPYFTGQCGLPIISRSSSGPSVSVFDPTQIGISPSIAQMLLGYPYTQATIGAWNSTGQLYNAACDFGGYIAPAGTNSLLFFGRSGGGPFCYGAGTDDPSLNLLPVPGSPGQIYCYDPVYQNEGTHGYPYTFFVWAYDLHDLADVKLGRRHPWDVVPYATWTLTLPFTVDNHLLTGATYDPGTQRVFLSCPGQDGALPVIHVLQLVV